MKNITLLFFVFLLAIATNTLAEKEPSSPSPQNPPPVGQQIQGSGTTQTTSIYLLGREPKNDERNKDGTYVTDKRSGKRMSEISFSAGIGDTVVVYLSDKDNELIYLANCLYKDRTPRENCTKKNIALYLDGRNVAERRYDDLVNANYIEFKLAYEESEDGWNNKPKWNELLGSPTWGDKFFDKPVTVMVGLANAANTNDLVAVGSNGKFRLMRISWIKFAGGLAVLALLLWVIYKYVPNSGLLRNGNKDTKWSLARCQMAFWFILIIYSFLFVWGITGAMDTITSQTLVMMGLSSGTLLGAALIDTAKDTDSRLKEIQASIQKFTTDNTTLQAQQTAAAQANHAAAADGLQALINENNRRILLLTEEVNKYQNIDKTTHSFWEDIVTDPGGSPALHRFQIVAWTMVLGFIFIYSVWKNLTMPAFSETLLSLMGLSSATYLGFKVPENRGP